MKVLDIKCSSIERGAATAVWPQLPMLSPSVAHTRRIQKYILLQFQNSELCVQKVAGDAGISVRCVHSLFGALGCAVSQWIMERNLDVCRGLLRARRVATGAFPNKNYEKHRIQSALRFVAPLFMVGVFFGVNSAQSATFTVREVTESLLKGDASKPVDFSGRDLSYLDLAELDFKRAILVNADLSGADLSAASLIGANLAGARLYGATLVKADFTGANLEGAMIVETNVYFSELPDYNEAPKFNGANLRSAHIASRLEGADFRDADLTGATIGLSDLSLDAQRAGRDWYRAPSSLMMRTDFSGANLSAAEVRNVNFTSGKFVGTKLRGSKLVNLDFTKADFSDADFTGADISGSNFKYSNLAGAKGLESLVGLQTAKNFDKAVR